MSERSRPWLEGVVGTLVAARFLRETPLPNRNRLAVILLDTALEIACRVYLRHEKKIKLTDAHRDRVTLIKTARSNLASIDGQVWESLEFYYDIRCDLYHENAAKTLTDDGLLDYQETVYFVINTAFGIKAEELVEAQLQAALASQPRASGAADEVEIPWHELSGRTERVLAAVAVLRPKTVDEVNELFKKEGMGLRLSGADFTGIVARNSGTKKLFYFNRDQKRWDLSGLGKFRLSAVLKEAVA